MSHSDKPKTIEGDWDRLYLEFPDVYDRFALSTTSGIAALCDWFDWTDKMVLDVGSGTGRSTFELAKKAGFVIGVEPWVSMREFAIAKARSQGISNVVFVNATAEAMPFQDQSVDLIVSIHAFPFGFFFIGGQPKSAEQFLADAFRIAKQGGHILIVNAAPGYVRPEVTAKAAQETRDAEMLLSLSRLMTQTFNFEYRDFLVNADYGSVPEALETYGFIYGQQAIDYLISHQLGSIPWNLRVYFKKVER